MVSTTSKLRALSDRLKAHQRELILSAAEYDMVPPDGTIRWISDLENAIVAVETLLHEELKVA